MPEGRAKLFPHGGSQAVRLPKPFRFQGEEVRIRKDGDRVILEPVQRDWNRFWGRIDALGRGERDEGAPPADAPELDR